MSLLKDIADRAVTVEVDGEPVHLRYASEDAKMEMYEKLNAVEQTGTEEGNVRAARIWNDIMADCLAATVVGHEDMERDDWLRLIATSNNEPEKHDGLLKLVREALRLSGYASMLRDGEEDDSGVTDHMKEAEAVLGDDPT